MSFTESLDAIVARNHNGLMGARPGWGRIRLGDVATIQNGFPFESARFAATGGTPLLRIRDVVRGRTETHYVGDVDPNYLVHSNDLVVGMDGDFNAALWQGEPALLNQRVCRIMPDELRYSKRLLHYVLPGYLRAINENTPSVTVKHLSSRTLADIPLPLPNLEEQRLLVAHLDEQFSRLDAGVEALKRAQTNLKRYRASVLKAACEGRLVPAEAELARQASTSPTQHSTYESGDQLLARILEERRRTWTGKGKYKEPTAPATANLPELPEGWTWATVEQLAAPESHSITDGPFGSNLKTEHYTDAGPRVIRLQNIGDGVFQNAIAHISESHFEKLQRHRVFPDDVVIAGLGEAPPRSCLIPPSLGPAIVKADCIRFKPHPWVLPAYINAVLNAEPTKKRLKDTVHGVGRPRLNLSEIKAIVIPLPPLLEQERIVAEVERRLSVAEALEATLTANLRRATRLRQAILQTAFSGGGG